MHLHFSHRHLARFILLALLTFLALLGGTTSSASASPASPPASPAPGSPPSTLSSISLRSEQPFTPAALFFPVSQVRLLDGPFKRRYDANARYLIDLLDPDRLLAPYRAQADLPPRAPFYGGWESRNSGASGHTLGHYLTALAYLQATTDDDKTRAEARRRVDYIVAELTACHRAKGTGAIMPVAPRATFPLPDIPVPYYNLHKLLAGLRDAYELAGNQNALALSRSIADWLDTLLRPLTRQQIQHMLAREYGGMNEVLADLAADTHDPRYLRMASAYFHRDALLAPLYRGEDRLGAQHANAQIPILAGLAREYELTGDPRYRAAATAFWNHVVNDRSYVTGGHGESEHFFPPAQFPGKLTSRTCETCNTNNMLKLTRHLFEWAPDAAQMDYVERALINHLAANIGERPGEFGYFLPLCSVAVKAYSKPLDAFWCCVGTGMENPAKYADQIYAHAAALSSPAGGVHAASYPVAAAAFTPPPIPALYINQYIASTLDYSEAALHLTMETQFPDSDTIRIKITTADHAPRHFTLNLRHPAWCAAPEITITTPQKTAPVGASLATPSAPLSNPVSAIPVAPPRNSALRILPHLWRDDLRVDPLLLSSGSGGVYAARPRPRLLPRSHPRLERRRPHHPAPPHDSSRRAAPAHRQQNHRPPLRPRCPRRHHSRPQKHHPLFQPAQRPLQNRFPSPSHRRAQHHRRPREPPPRRSPLRRISRRWPLPPRRPRSHPPRLPLIQ